MPSHNDLFTGRESYLEKLGQFFSPRRTVSPARRLLLHGMGGAGKTQVALKFVEQSVGR